MVSEEFAIIRDLLQQILSEQHVLADTVSSHHEAVAHVLAGIRLQGPTAQSSQRKEGIDSLDGKWRSNQEPGCRFTVSQSSSNYDSNPLVAEHRRGDRLQQLLKFGETQCAQVSPRNGMSTYTRWRSMKWDSYSLERIIDAVMVVVIVCNSIYMGMTMDADGTQKWLARTGITFTTIFTVEVCLKVRLRGLRAHFCGDKAVAHIFDAMLVAMDIFQIVSRGIKGFNEIHAFFPTALFRLLRLFRLTMIARVLGWPVFHELFVMIHALKGGIRILGWSFVLAFIFLYCIGLICRELLGKDDNSNVHAHFESVPRSVFTVFRCSFGDCSSSEGQPIIEQVALLHGSLWPILFTCFTYFVTIGFFNVITAIFLETTLEAAEDLNAHKERERLIDEDRWAGCVFGITRKLLDYVGVDVAKDLQLSDQMDLVLGFRVARKQFTKLATEDDEVFKILRMLDIDSRDDEKLASIFDTNHTGDLSILEIVNGLQRVRGSRIRRSDIVAVDLLVRDLQTTTAQLVNDVRSLERLMVHAIPAEDHQLPRRLRS